MFPGYMFLLPEGRIEEVGGIRGKPDEHTEREISQLCVQHLGHIVGVWAPRELGRLVIQIYC